MASDLAVFAGPAGVGAIGILGVFLFLDGRDPRLFPTVETYAKTATWGVVAAVPLLVMAYVLGLFLISAAEGALVFRKFDEEAADLAVLASFSAEKSAAIQAYVQLQRDKTILAGTAIAVLPLGAGALSEISNLKDLSTPIVIASLCVFVLSPALVYVAHGKGRRAHALAQRVLSTTPPKALAE